MGGAVPLVEPELSPLSASKTRKTLNDGNVNDQVTSLGQRNPIDYPDQSAIDYLDHSQRFLELATSSAVPAYHFSLLVPPLLLDGLLPPGLAGRYVLVLGGF